MSLDLGSGVALDDFAITESGGGTDVTTAADSVTCAITFTGTALIDAGCVMISPSGERRRSGIVRTPAGDVWTCTIPFLAQDEAGTWAVEYVFARTTATNKLRATYAEIWAGAAGLPSVTTEADLQVAVTSTNEDVDPPSIVGFTALPSNPEQGDIVTCTISATDAGSGIFETGCTFVHLLSGDTLSTVGTSPIGLVIPIDAAIGQWTEVNRFARDNVINATTVEGSAVFIVQQDTDPCASTIADFTAPVPPAWLATQGLGAQATSTATWEFYARPGELSQDVVIGLSKSTPIDGYADNSVLIRFNTNDTIDARDGATYRADLAIPYVPAHWYHFEVAVNITANTYTVQVEDCDSGLETLITDAAFRSDAPAPQDALEYWSMIQSIGVESFEIADMSWVPAGVSTEQITVDLFGAPDGASWTLSPDPGGGNGSGTKADGNKVFQAALAEYTIDWLDTAFAQVPPNDEVIELTAGTPITFDLSPNNYTPRTGRTGLNSVRVEGGPEDSQETWTVDAEAPFGPSDFTQAGEQDAVISGTFYDGREYKVTFDDITNYNTPTGVSNITASASSQEFVGTYVARGGLNTRDIDVNGWTYFDPADADNIYYVSESGDNGDDGSYATPWETLEYAISQASGNNANWILLKRGDQFPTSAQIVVDWDGTSRTRPWLIGAYGTGADHEARMLNVTDARPEIRTGSHNGIRSYSGASYICLVGLWWHANERDSDDPSWIGEAAAFAEDPSGIDWFTNAPPAASVGMLLEDCEFSHYDGNGFSTGADSAKGIQSDLSIRRNIIRNNFAGSGHSQGMWIYGYGNAAGDPGVLMEENVFDHNGWWRQGDGGSSGSNGKATIYNHNCYFHCNRHSIYRGNISTRPSSMHHKCTSNNAGGYTADELWDNNLYVDGEIMLSIGGNATAEGIVRWTNLEIKNCVCIKPGQSHTTGRTIGNGIEMIDNAGTWIHDNIFADGVSATAIPQHAIKFDGVMEATPAVSVVEDNIIYKFSDGGGATFRGGSLIEWGRTGLADNYSVNFRNNVMHADDNVELWESKAGSLNPQFYSGNRWYSGRSAGNWFELSSGTTDYAGWVAETGETGGDDTTPSYVDASVTLEGYMSSIGETATYARFLELIIQQRRGAWDTDLEASAINDYFRAGFTLV